jgi:methyl-accepting chemotaxis protein
VIFTDPNVTASNLYIRINKLTDDIARLTSERDKVILDKTIQGDELEKISKLAKESGDTISNQSLQINDLKEKVTHLNDSLKEAIDTGVTQVVELANKLNKVLTERNTLADEGKKMSDNLKDALNTIDSINNY